MKYQHRIPAQHRPKNARQTNIQSDKADQYPKLKPLLKATSSIPSARQDDGNCFILGYN